MSRGNVIALILFGGLLLWVFTLDAEMTQNVQRKVLSLFSPFQRAGTEIRDGVDKVRENRSLDPRELLEENEQLRREVAELRIYRDELIKLREDWNDITRLLDLKEETHLSLMAARVIGRDNALFMGKTLTINKGSRSGIAVESPVLNDQGLIGKTNVIGMAESTVLLLTDEQCMVAARIEGTNERGIVKGVRGTPSESPELKLRILSKNEKIQPGAKVFTSGEGGLFPAGIPIGEVKEFRVQEVYGYSEAVIQPAVDFSRLRFVFVLNTDGGELAERKNGDGT